MEFLCADFQRHMVYYNRPKWGCQESDILSRLRRFAMFFHIYKNNITLVSAFLALAKMVQFYKWRFPLHASNLRERIITVNPSRRNV